MGKIEKVLQALKEQQLDGLFIVKKANVNYISKFTDEAAFVLITRKGNFFITDGRFIELAEKLCEGFEIINWQDLGKGVLGVVEKICKDVGIKRLGFEEEWTSYSMYENMKGILKDIELIPTKGIIEALRYIKDEEEINILREASRITDEAFEEILNHIKPGMTENQVAAKLEYIIKMNGGDGVGFETILISGKKTSLPHGKPDDKVIEDGDFVTLDFGALYKGYTSDMTKTIVVGKPNEKQIEIYNVVKEAQQAGLDTIKDGISSKVPDDAIREVVKDYIEYYYPGIGHGIGRDLHEPPFIGKNGGYIIKKNCVITVEPGLYIPDWGGVRIEDSILVTEDGYERLTKSTKDLICL